MVGSIVRFPNGIMALVADTTVDGAFSIFHVSHAPAAVAVEIDINGDTAYVIGLHAIVSPTDLANTTTIATLDLDTVADIRHELNIQARLAEIFNTPVIVDKAVEAFFKELNERRFAELFDMLDAEDYDEDDDGEY